MNYEEYVKDVFIEHQNCMGMDLDEAKDLFNESSFARVENWLKKRGYDLWEDYKNA